MRWGEVWNYWGVNCECSKTAIFDRIISRAESFLIGCNFSIYSVKVHRCFLEGSTFCSFENRIYLIWFANGRQWHNSLYIFFYIKVGMENFPNLVTLDFKKNFVGADQ